MYIMLVLGLASAECESTLRPDPKIEVQVFMAPIFRGDVDEERRQKWAIETWLDACRHKKARLVLLAADGFTVEFAQSRGIPHLCLTRTVFGPPRFDEIIHIIHKSIERGVVVFVNSDIGAGHVEKLVKVTTLLGKRHPVRAEWGRFETDWDEPAHAEWLAVARRFDVSSEDATTKNKDGGYDLWAWNVFPGCRPLLPFDVPQFKIARPTFDNWFLSVSISTGYRHVIDATDAIVTFHHVHQHRFREDGPAAQGGYDEFYKNGNIDSYINRHLAFRLYEWENRSYSYAWTHGTACEAPFVLGANNVTTRRFRSNFLCTPCYLRNFHMECPEDGVGDVDGAWGKRVAALTRNQTARNRRQTRLLPGLGVDDSVIPDKHYYGPVKERWPYSFPRILELRATASRVVVLVTANNAARSFVANFHCNMQRLGVAHHVLAALDDDLYYWAVLESIPVFQVQAMRSANAYATFNSAEFNAVTKMKIAVVVQVLKAGYSVLVSDADVVWIRNPLPLFAQLAATHTMYVQSNAPLLLPDHGSRNVSFSDRVVVLRHEDDMASGVNKINSGLYFVPASDLAVRAFQALHKEAHAHPEYNDQPSFSRVLCTDPGVRIDNETCVYKFRSRSLEIRMLPRLQFATGAVYVGQTERLIEVANANSARSLEPPLFALHYNWVEGAATKRRLIERAGFWFQDGAFCTFPSKTPRRVRSLSGPLRRSR